MAPKRTTRSTPVTPTPNATPTTTVTEAQLQALIDQGVAAAMAEAEASRVRNGYNSNGSGPRPAQTARECSYSEFLKCKPLDFKGTEGVVGLTRWFEKMESVFSISNCTAASQVKFATCTLLIFLFRSLGNKILVPEPESSPCCAKCGTSVDGPYCRGCALLRKNFKGDLLTCCGENETSKDFEDIFESSDDNTNVVFRGEKIDEEYEKDYEIRIRKLKQDSNEWGSKVRKKEQAYEEEKYSAARRYMFYIPFVDEDDYNPLGDIVARYSTSKAITSDLPIEEPDNSLIMEDEHLDTIPETESDEFIKSSVENLDQNLSESADLSNGESECDVPINDDCGISYIITRGRLLDLASF
ncbi:hypothetical protein Tco_1069664 [Tanacetum coccineum]|uniref:Reverse transcriptase domain-containing protein n=1 Tax=Tanacetum coccineum TaxID=301880 RepID=A0ABQ5HJ61_9ASTR